MANPLQDTMCQACASAKTGTSDHGLPMVWVGGHWRILASLPSKPETLARVTPAAEYFERTKIAIIPESRWADYAGITNRPHVRHILDQDGVGSCAWEDVAQMMMIVMSLQGQPVELLNPWTGYRQTNTRDVGSDTMENVEVAAKVGILPMKYWDRAKHGWSSTPPSGWEAIAANYQVDEYIRFETEMELQTWLRLGRVGGLSNASFWGGGHSTCAAEPHPNGDISGPNSWDVTYGDKGWYTMPRRHVQRGFSEGFSQCGIVSVKISGAYAGDAGLGS